MRSFYIFLSTFFLCLPVWGQHTSNLHEQYQFKALTIDNGLSNNRVRTMAQDQYGYLWMGTRKGISRYDGHSFKNYTFFFINDTLSENMLELRESLFDANGNLWFGGYNGLLKYNLQKDRFERISLADDEVVRNCMGMAQDYDSTIWFALSDRLVHYNVKDKSKKIYVYNPMDSIHSPPSKQMERITLGGKDDVWITALQQGLILFNKTTGIFTFFKPTGKPGALAGVSVEKVYEDPQGKIWVSYRDQGLSLFNPVTQTFKTYFPDPAATQSGRVRGLLVDPNGNFWVGTQNGVYLFDREKETFLQYASMSHPKSRLSHNSIYFFFLDKHQNFWMGTHAGGVNYTNLNTSGFTKYDYSPISNNYFLNDNSIYALQVDDKNNIWIGTGSGGLNYIERRTGKFKYYVNVVNDKSSIPANDIKAIAIRKNAIWLGVFGFGLAYLDRNTDKFYPENSIEISKLGANITSLAFDPESDNLLWVGTERGLALLDITTKKTIQIAPGTLPGFDVPEGMHTQKVSKVVTIDQHRIAFAMDAGVFVLDYSTHTITTINKVNGTEVAGIQFANVDEKGALWFGSNRGVLFRVKLNTDSANVYTPRQGLPDVEMYGGLDDDQGNLWVSSNNGLYRFRNLVNKPDSLLVDRFDQEDNLQSIEFNFGAYAKGLNNELFFGGINGFNSFNPAHIKRNPYKPFVHITNLMIENKPVAIGQEIGGNVVLTTSILNTEKIEIQPNTKSFAITFNALHYSAPEANQLAYKLDGYDEDWTYLKGAEGTATYTSIPPGIYVFRVKAANNDGLWNEEGDSITITIPTPFYKAIWFYVLVTLTLAALVYWFIKMRTRNLNEDKKTLQRAIDEKTNEVEGVKQEILRQDEANKIKNWLNSKLKEFVVVIANKNKEDIKMLSRTTLNFFKEAIGTPVGTVLLLNDTDPDDVYLENVMAETLDKDIRKGYRHIKPGEGPAGTCFSHAERRLMTVIPADYIKIASGLGEAIPKNLLLVPIKIEDKVMGVVELCSFTEFLPHHIDLVENVVESLASTLFIMRTNQVTQLLLERTKEQTEQLQAQEEEMRQNMEELEATTESYKRRELELEARIEELIRKNKH